MAHSTRYAWLLILFVGACATRPLLAPNHPGRSDAPVAAAPEIASMLHVDPVPIDAEADVDPHAGHHMMMGPAPAETPSVAPSEHGVVHDAAR